MPIHKSMTWVDQRPRLNRSYIVAYTIRHNNKSPNANSLGQCTPRVVHWSRNAHQAPVKHLAERRDPTTRNRIWGWVDTSCASGPRRSELLWQGQPPRRLVFGNDSWRFTAKLSEARLAQSVERKKQDGVPYKNQGTIGPESGARVPSGAPSQI